MRVGLRRRAGGSLLNAVAATQSVQGSHSQPFEKAGSRRRLIENPKTFLVAISRAQWRGLPLEFITGPGTLGQPHLVFDDELVAVALQLDIDRLHAKRTRSWKGDERRYLAMLIRRKHLARVALAVGYTWPGNPPGHIEFAPDA